MTPETVTILRCAGGEPAHKIYGVNGVTDYSARSFVTFEQKTISGLADFAQLLGVLEGEASAFIIRGIPIRPSDAGRSVRRRALGSDAAFASRESRLLCIDVDNVQALEGMSPCSDEAINHVIGLLPAEFHRASCVVQFSNSAGTEKAGNRIKLHLWFWGAKTYSDRELRRWAMTTVADWHLYNAVQPHYTARPRFDGIPDPFSGGSRVRFLKKEMDAVAIELPSVTAFSAKPGRLSEIERADLQYGQSGKVIDGREALLRDIRWSILLRGHCCSEAQFVEKVWTAFTEEAEIGRTSLSDNFYDHEKIVSLCVRDWANHGALIPAAERPSLSADEAAAALDKEISAALIWHGVTAIRATAGLGKTTKAAEALMDISDLSAKRIDIYARSKVEQRQWLNLLTNASKERGAPIQIRLIEGRGETNCVQHEAAKALSESGVSVSPNLCGTKENRCKAFDGCPYLGQFSSSAPGIRIYSHAHLPTPLHDGLPKPDIVIIDESFHDAATYVSKSFDSSQLRSWALLRTDVLAQGISGEGTHFGFQELKHTSLAVVEAIASGKPILEELRGRGVTPEALSEAAQLVTKSLKHPRVDPHASLGTIKAELARCRAQNGRLSSLIFTSLAAELKTGRDASHCLMPDQNGMMRACSRKDISRRCDAATVLILDADCDEVILGAFFPAARMVKIDAKLNAEIIQIDDLTLSKSSLGLGAKGKLNLKLIGRVAEVASEYPAPLIITYRSLIPHLEPRLPRAKFGYFGNIRGSNEWKDCGTVIVIGRHCVPADAIEASARGLFWDASEPLSLGTPHPRRYIVGKGVLVSQDEIDPRCQALRVASRDAETRQALARLRLVHSPERKTVVLLSSQVAGVPVDSLIQLRPRRGVRLVRQFGDFLPFASEDLARLAPGDFRSAKEALAWRDRPENTPAVLIEDFKRAGVIMAQTSYRRPGQRGRPTPLLVDPMSHPRPELSLPKHLTPPGEKPPVIKPLDWEEWGNPDAPPWILSYRLRKTSSEGG